VEFVQQVLEKRQLRGRVWHQWYVAWASNTRKLPGAACPFNCRLTPCHIRFDAADLVVERVLSAERTASMVLSEEQARKVREEMQRSAESGGEAETKAAGPPNIDADATSAATTEPVGDAAVGVGAVLSPGHPRASSSSAPTNTTALLSPGSLTMDQTSLYPPGTLMHVVRPFVVCCCLADR